MKKLILVLLIIFSFNILLNINQNVNKNIVNAYLENNQSSEIVMELNSHRILYEKNCFEKKYMASTTKILTAITAIENSDINEKITVTNKTIGIEGSSIYLEAGEILSIKDLLYGLMLRSGNDCAETIAYHIGNGIDNFVSLMNKTAQKIGALNSNFVNPHGLHDDNHYTTAYDLALISCYAMKNDVFREIVGTKYISIPFTTRNTVRTLKNKNKILFNIDGATGIKTGYTKKAGRRLVSSVNKNGMELICVVLNCGPMFERSTQLFNESFNNFTLKKIVESDEIIGFAKNENNEDIPLHIKNDIILPIKNNEIDKIKVIYNFSKTIIEIKNEQEIGLVKIERENNLIFSEKIYTLL